MLLGFFVLGDVVTRAKIPGKAAIEIIERLPHVSNASILAVMTPQTILHLKGAPGMKRIEIGAHTTIQIIGMHVFCPSVAYLLLYGSPGECQPRLVEIVVFGIHSRPPNQCRKLFEQRQVEITCLDDGFFSSLARGDVADVALNYLSGTG